MFILTITSSFAEVISLGAVVPFIGILTQPERVHAYLSDSGLSRFITLPSPSNLVLPLTVGFALAAILAGALRLLLSWFAIRLANGVGTDLSIEVYRRTLYQPYSVHVSRSTSEIISGITQKVAAASGLLLSLVNVITSTMLFLAILGTLLIIDPIVASVAIVSFGASYTLIAWKTRARLMRNGRHISKQQTGVIKALQEGLGSIRDILIDGTQNVYCSIYKDATVQLQRSSGENNFINQAPRFVMEALGMVLIALFAYVLSFKEGGIAQALPVLGSLALGAQRLLPLLQILYGNWTVLLGSKASLEVVLELLHQPMPASFNSNLKPLQFNNFIKFDNIRFKYNANSPWVLDNINLTIKKGSRIGFVGSTGSGKSTTLDLVMALLVPTEGQIRIDDQVLTPENLRSWQQNIAHVPQNIFLTDGTIAENIAFGVPLEQIDLKRVKLAAENARLASFIDTRTEGYNLMVGERGVRLSGGQRQRIGIARALYKQASVLIFDEATSALDSQTESEVMSAIEQLNKDLTVLIIAHRVTTLQNCDSIVQLEHGKLIVQNSYNEFIKGHVGIT
ncbi:MAG TPA: ABC transporter ATP-binding protein [Bacteriovoracaceae bacterium]|nr:ABC transporter ATP-binding protein [Bacteriovoracaceae bacterium]